MKKVLLLSLILFSAWMLKAQSYSGGAGTSGNPFQIATKADLKFLSDNDTHYDGYYFQQTADIYFEASDFQSGGDFYYSGSGFLPIGGGSGATIRRFKSSYDGNNKVIDGIYMNRSEDDAGFFGEIEQLVEWSPNYAVLHTPTIENVTLTNVNITNNGTLTGGLVGQILNGVTVSNCAVSGSVTGIQTGGLTGQMESFATVSNSRSSASVSGTIIVGGLIGFAYGNVNKCYSTGDVSGQGNVGGFVGIVGEDAEIIDCYSKGDVNRTSGATGTTIGGFAGVVAYDEMMPEEGIVHHCYSLGSVNYINASNPTDKGFSGSYTGGFSSNYFDGDVSNQSSAAGATAKTTAQMKTQSTFVYWNFTTIWEIIGGNGANYPTLRDNPDQSEVTTPTTQASTIVFSSVQNTQMTVGWTNGDGTNRVVFAKQANTGATSPVDNTTYTANTSFGSGTEIATGWFCVYNGSGTNVTVTNLSHSTDYIFQVFEYNGGAGEELYLTSTATDNPKSQTTATPPVEPTTQATHIVFSGVQGNQMTVGWTDGNGSNRVVFAKEANTGTTTPVDNTTYTANTTFGSGTEIATGWYCVYNGTGSSVTVSGLSTNTEYIFQVFEYNGGSGEENYLTFSATNNPKSQPTLTIFKNTYSYTGSHQYSTVPTGITQISVKVWGAGGGGRTGSYSSNTGGSGGYTEATLNVTPGQQLCITVGQGGQRGATNGGDGGWPGGGYGTAGDASGGGGGGVVGVFLDSYSHSNALIIAGSGGGGGYHTGGYGGGTTGGTGGNAGGQGATQSAGGTGTSGDDGSALQGGNGDSQGSQTLSSPNDGSGGGAGYYGGEGGFTDARGGGGGSAYVNPTYLVGDATITQGNQGISGSWVNPPNTTDEDYVADVGIGTGSTYAYAGNGLVVISYSTNTITWTGSTNTDWNTATNWSPGTVPTASNNIVIPDVANDPVIVDGFSAYTALGASLSVEANATLTITDNTTLDLGGDLTNNGTINVNGNTGTYAYLDVDGTFDNNGSLSINPYGDVDALGHFDGTGGSISFTSSNTMYPGYLRLGAAVTSFGTMNYTMGTVIYNGTVAQTVIADDYYNLQMAGNSTKTIGGNLNVAASFTCADANTTINLGSHTLTASGFSVTAGTFNGNTGTVIASGLTNLTGYVAGTSTFRYTGTSGQGVGGNGVEFYDLELYPCSGSYRQIYYDLTVSNDLTQSDDAELRLYDYYGSSHNLTVGGTITNNGSIKMKSGGSVLDGGIAGSGSWEIPRVISEETWHLIGIPVTNALSGMFEGDYLQYWTESTASWTEIILLTEALIPGKGLSLWATPDKSNYTYTFTGAPNSGNVSRPITYTSLTETGFDGANLLGNPYPSSIDWSGLDDTYGAVNYWNGTAYVSWNNGSGAGTQYIPPMQGFFIVTSSNGTFSFENEHRTHTGASNFYKAPIVINDGLVLFADNGTYQDELWYLQRNEQQAGFDLECDAYKFMSSTPGLSQLWSVCPDGRLSIDARPYQETIQLGFANDVSGIYTIGIKWLADISTVILEDTKENRFQDLAMGHYEFVWENADPETRFKLHFEKINLEDTNVNEPDILIHAADGQIFIQGQAAGDLKIMDITGRLVLNQTIQASDVISVPANLTTGVYLVLVKQANHTQIEKIYLR